MKTSISLESLVVKLDISLDGMRNTCGEALNYGLRQLIGLFRNNTPNNDPPNGNHKQNGSQRAVKTTWGEELGYLVDMEFFKNNFQGFPEYIVEWINYSDRRNKSLHKNESRKMGGVYDRHPLAMLKSYYEIAKSIAPDIAQIAGCSLEESLAKVLDYRFIIALKRHDDFEDIAELKCKLKLFRVASQAVSRLSPEEREASQEYGDMMGLRKEIKKIRKAAIEQEYASQNKFLVSLASKHNLSLKQKAELTRDGSIVIGIMDWLTRHTEEIFFTESMFWLHQRYSAKSYNSKEGRGGPFQAKLMRKLGIKGDGQEPAEYFLMRILLRGLDRVANSGERKPNYDDSKRMELSHLFKQNPWLSNVYGNISFHATEEMTRPVLLDIIYKNFVVLNNMHFALNNYGEDIAGRKNENIAAYGYLLSILKARECIIRESKGIINELKASYREDLGEEEAREIQERVKNMPQFEREEVSGEGPISHGWKYETGLLVNKEKGDKLQIRQNYLNLLMSEGLIETFFDSQRNKIDLENNKFNLFTMKKLRDGISVELRAKPWTTG